MTDARLTEDPVAEKLFFETVSEIREGYIVRYTPPNPGYRFATANLTFTSSTSVAGAADAMKLEAQHWAVKYPVPVMVSSFDESGISMDLSSVQPASHLIAFIKDEVSELEMHWQLLKDEEIPDTALDIDYLRAVFSDISFRTSTALRKEAESTARQLRAGWVLVFIWAVIVPALASLISFFSPRWLAIIVLIYSLYKAVIKGLRLTGRLPTPDRKQAEQKKKRIMLHHHYHCEQNPEGFQRIKLENFERWEREAIQREAEGLRNKQ